MQNFCSFKFVLTNLESYLMLSNNSIKVLNVQNSNLELLKLELLELVPTLN